MNITLMKALKSLVRLNNKQTLPIFSKGIIALLFFFVTLQGIAQDEATADAEKTDTEEKAKDEGESGGSEGNLELGKQVYEGNCAQCHEFNKVLVGPALSGAVGRWPSKEVLHEFIKYPQKIIDAGEVDHAVELYEKYKQYMPNHDHLSDEEIDAVIAYIESDPQPEQKEEATAAAEGGTKVVEKGVDETTLSIIFGALILILAIVLIILLLVIYALTNYLKQSKEDLNEEDEELLSQRFNLIDIAKSQAFIGIVAFIFTVLVVKEAFDFVYGIGVQQGYTPTQPVKFSHKLHAGNYEIDCQYCHTGVRMGKSAHIPSVNICMNCHNTVKTESPQIKKLYAAIENDQPIEWVRVHNLPDLVYFNHSQHVVVGEIECETCHGPVEEMEVITHFSSLTMGWCINCHRETVVQAEGNPYYDRLVEFHSSVEESEMVVEDIGGLECGRCHY